MLLSQYAFCQPVVEWIAADEAVIRHGSKGLWKAYRMADGEWRIETRGGRRVVANHRFIALLKEHPYGQG